VDPDPDSDPDPQHWFILIGRVQYVMVWYIMYRYGTVYYMSLRYGILGTTVGCVTLAFKVWQTRCSQTLCGIWIRYRTCV
jgi:hypothetical protein